MAKARAVLMPAWALLPCSRRSSELLIQVDVFAAGPFVIGLARGCLQHHVGLGGVVTTECQNLRKGRRLVLQLLAQFPRRAVEALVLAAHQQLIKLPSLTALDCKALVLAIKSRWLRVRLC